MPPHAAYESVKVCVRCRPLNAKETDAGRQSVVEVDGNAITLKGGGGARGTGTTAEERTFTFDQVRRDARCESTGLAPPGCDCARWGGTSCQRHAADMPCWSRTHNSPPL